MSTICRNASCGLEYNEDSECVYHSGKPVFHDGLKGWSCCQKRVVDFDSFLKIGGCTTGNHSLNTPKVSHSQETEQVTEKNNISLEKPKNVLQETENFKSSHQSISSEKQTLQNEKKESIAKIPELELFDQPGVIINPDAKCKRPSCGLGLSEKEQECIFHSGTPLFHEGSKGWSCCSRRVLEFDEFLKIKGCCTGKHRFTDGLIKNGPVNLHVIL
jgi:hypothetical protein